MSAVSFAALMASRRVRKHRGTARSFAEILQRRRVVVPAGAAARHEAASGRVLAIAKGDAQLVWAIASTAGGPPDDQGDVIEADVLVAAAHGFMAGGGEVKAMHRGEPVGRAVESMVLTSEVQKALGIKLSNEPWIVCLKVDDVATWQRVKAGDLAALSIGGRARREPMGDDEAA